MADEKISQLTDGTAPTDVDEFAIARSGSNFSLTWAEIKAAISSSVTSVFGRTGAVTAQTGDYTAAQVGALPSTDDLSAIASANATAASVAMNSHKLTGLAAGTGAGDSVRYEQALLSGAVTAGDTSIVVGGTGVAPTLETATLDVIATDHPPAAAWSNNSQKITSLANGSGAQDAAAFGQIPTALPPNGSAGGDLAGTYPNPTVAKLTETSGPTDLTIGTITDGQFLKRSGTTIVSAAASGSQDQYPNTYLTVADETIPANTQVIYDDYLELAASFEYELAVGAVLVIGAFDVVPLVTLPGYEFGYDQITATVNITGLTGAESTAPTTAITCNPHWFDGGPVFADFSGLCNTDTAATGDAFIVSLYEQGTQLTRLAYRQTEASVQGRVTLRGGYRFTPTQGFHSYTVGIVVSSTTGTPQLIAGSGGVSSFAPCYVRFTKV